MTSSPPDKLDVASPTVSLAKDIEKFVLSASRLHKALPWLAGALIGSGGAVLAGPIVIANVTESVVPAVQTAALSVVGGMLGVLISSGLSRLGLFLNRNPRVEAAGSLLLGMTLRVVRLRSRDEWEADRRRWTHRLVHGDSTPEEIRKDFQIIRETVDFGHKSARLDEVKELIDSSSLSDSEKLRAAELVRQELEDLGREVSAPVQESPEATDTNRDAGERVRE
jgi:hypothetical protein